MTLSRPFGPKLFILTATVQFTTVFILLILWGPLNEWWAALFPRELAVYRLQNAPPGIDFSGCPFGPAEQWQIIRADTNAETLFDSVVTFAATPAGTLFGLAGLYDLGSPRFPVLRDSVRGAAIDSLYVYGEPSQERWIQVRAMLDRRFLDSAVSFLKRPTPSFEC